MHGEDGGQASQPIEKSTAGASLLSQVMWRNTPITCRCTGGENLPALRRGIERPDHCGWMRQCAGLLDPLYFCLKDFVLSSKVVGTDDTPVKVLDRISRRPEKGESGRMSETGIIRL